MYLGGLLKSLHEGNTVTLESRQNQYGDKVGVEDLFFRKGKWLRSWLNCRSSQDYGFGTCRCNSHPSFMTKRISRKEVLEALRELARRDLAEQEACQVEIDWINKSISELVD